MPSKILQMKRILITLFIITGIIAISCKSKQVSPVSSTDEPAIQLDTVKVLANSSPEKKVYQASNTRMNDLLHTKLEVSFDWQKSYLFGKATLKIKPYFYPTSMLYLNARGMEIKEVSLLEMNGDKQIAKKTLKYVYENDSLKINLDKEYKNSETYSVFVDYIAKPEELKSLGGSMAISSDKGLYFINPRGEDKNKMPQIWTQGETQSNQVWFPTIDSPNERMTEEILITVDNKYTTLSNGDLLSQKNNPDGTRTDHWKMSQPHAPYLVMMGIGEFKVVKDTWKGKQVNYYIEKEYEPHAKAIFGNTPEMIEFFSNKLGYPYAWSKYSQIVVRDYVSGAMENTTATVHGDFVYQTERELIDGSRGEDVIAHELFHQWFGDVVTCESWSNLPLNESFATYGEYLWNEYKYGQDAADAHHYGSRSGYMAESENKKVNMIRFDYKNREDMFDGHSYNKGGQILHMLRKYVGDDAFFKSLQLYLERNQFTSVEIHQLRLAFEEVTGEDLNWFFNQWFLACGHPVVDINYSYDDATKMIKVTVRQKQDFSKTPLFRLPVYIDHYHADPKGGVIKKREKVVVSDESQVFEFSVSDRPLLVNFDGDKALLCKKTENKSRSEYLVQYQYAPNYIDRLEALQAFKGGVKDPQVYEIAKLALKDNWKGHRSKAIGLLYEVAKDREAELKPLLVELAKNDVSTQVRAEAIVFLSKNYSGDDLNNLYKQSLNEKSYMVMGAALDAISEKDPASAVLKAKELENEPGDMLSITIMDIYSRYGDESCHAYFMKKKENFTGFDAIGFVNVYSIYLKRSSDNVILEGAGVLKDFASQKGNMYLKFSAQKALKDLLNKFQDKEDALSGRLEEAKANNTDSTVIQSELEKISSMKSKLKAIYDETNR